MGKPRVSRAVIAVAIGLAVIMGACTRSASTPPPATDGAEGTPSGLTAQQQTMEAVRSELLTQTAQANTGEGEGENEATATPEPTSASEATEAPTEAPAATATVGIPSTYTLEDGEHPYCIARRFDIDPTQLLSVNGLDRSSSISPGMTLTIPQDTGGFPPPRALREHPTTYTVQSGETIYAVACRFGDVRPIAIAEANGLTEPYNLSAGTVLEIP
ncbi:MAG: LysM peptidoglycan-binding domain-containing protein [Anaerolineales bacterium]